jgi:predicted AlkP superfamily phosphohydrolase/phosphomutase
MLACVPNQLGEAEVKRVDTIRRQFNFTSGRRGARLLFTLLASIALLACGGGDDYQRPGRILVIGIDGASPWLVAKLIAAGQMPNLAKLAQEGAAGTLRSNKPIKSPRIWNTVVTGKMPEKHGILDFAKRDGKGHTLLYTSTDRRARPVWSIAGAEGLTVGIVNFWNTYPLERVNGVMVSDHLLAKEIDGRERMTNAVKTGVGSVVYPENWNADLAKLVQDDTTPIPDFENPFADDKPLPRWVLRNELQRRFAEDGALARIAQEISQKSRPDLLMVLLPGVDRISHYIWGVVEPGEKYPPGLQPTPEGREGGRQALFSYYEYADALVGALMEDYGPDDLIMVVSDHGFEAGQALLRLSGVHDSDGAINGIFYARGPGIAPGTQVQQLGVEDITPTLLSWMGLATAADMDGSPAPFVEVPQLPAIATYDIGKLSFVDPEKTPSGVEEDIVDQLKMLGYIDEEEGQE